MKSGIYKLYNLYRAHHNVNILKKNPKPYFISTFLCCHILPVIKIKNVKVPILCFNTII